MKTKLFVLVLALQSAWMLGIVATQERALRVGQVILLETQPVDPRDLLRGDYVILNYKISAVPASLLPDSARQNLPHTGEIFVAVALTGTNQFWEITRADKQRFAPAANEVLLRGQAAKGWRNTADFINVEYSLERYYVREGTGNPRGKLTVQVAVPASGNAIIRQVFLDGKPYAEAMKEQK